MSDDLFGLPELNIHAPMPPVKPPKRENKLEEGTMKTLVIIPNGWPCKLNECPPGLFVYNGWLGFKSEYIPRTAPAWSKDSDVYVVASGEFWETQNIEVQPYIAQWSSEEDEE